MTSPRQLSSHKLPSPVQVYLEADISGMEEALAALAAPLVLTRDLALQLLEKASDLGMESAFLWEALTCSTLLVHRNSEYHLEPECRASILAHLPPMHEVQQWLADLVKNGHPSDELGIEWPTYLFGPVGTAYHCAELNPEEGLRLYAKGFSHKHNGTQWMLGRAAEEQQFRRILPSEAIEPLFLRGINLYQEGRKHDALPLLNQVAQSRIDRQEVSISIHLLGVMKFHSNALPEALALFDQSIAIYDRLPGSFGVAFVLNSRGGVKRKLGDLEGALQDLNRAAELGDERTLAAVLNSRGGVKRDLGDLEGALQDLNRAAELGDERTLAAVLNSRGGVKRDLGDLEGALQDYNQLLQILNSRPSPSFNRQMINNQRKKLSKLQHQLEIASTNLERSKLLSIFYFEIAKNSLRSKHRSYYPIFLIKRVIKLDVDRELYSGCMFSLGKANFKINRLDEAAIYFQKAIDSGWDSSEAYATLAYVLTLLGESLDKTRNLFERSIAIDINDENAWAKSWFALALSAAGEHTTAESFGYAAVAKPPHDRNAILLFNLARVLDATGDSDKQNKAIVIAEQSAELADSGFVLPEQFLAARR